MVDFYINEDTLEFKPLNLVVDLKSSSIPSLPETRDRTQEIPGMDGDIDLGSDYQPLTFSIVARTREGLTARRKNDTKDLVNTFLNEAKSDGARLRFAYDSYRFYYVAFRGKLDITEYPSWIEFVIPLRASDPFKYSWLLHRYRGTGEAYDIFNKGNMPADIVIEIAGPAENPACLIGGAEITYNGAVPDGKTVIINTQRQTAKIDDTNVLSNIGGPLGDLLLQPGMTSSTLPACATISWHDKWL